MEPLNSSERTTATLKVAGIFVVTFIVLIIAVLIGTKLPTYQNEQLTAENAKLRQNKDLIDKAIRSMDSLNNYITRYKKDPQSTGMLDNLIPKETTNLLEYSKQDSIVGPIISRSIAVYTDDHTNLKELLKNGTSTGDVAKLQAMVNEKDAKYNQCQKDLTDLQLKIQQNAARP